MGKKEIISHSHNKVDAKAAVQALEYLLAAGYVNKRRLYLENFLRGLFFSVGTIIGATLVISILLWGLSLFNDVPFIGDVVENVQMTIDKNTN